MVGCDNTLFQQHPFVVLSLHLIEHNHFPQQKNLFTGSKSFEGGKGMRCHLQIICIMLCQFVINTKEYPRNYRPEEITVLRCAQVEKHNQLAQTEQ